MSMMSASVEERLARISEDKRDLFELLLQEESRSDQAIKPYPRAAGSVMRLPTSWAQERLWFIDHLEGGSAAYHSGVAVRLRGSLNLHALQRALNSLIQRHEILRTRFVTVDGEPKQEIGPATDFFLQRIDLSAHERPEREAQVRLHKRCEVQEPFDLGVGPLIRGRLVKLDEDEHVFVVTLHHIVSDAWSKSVLIKELTTLYEAYREGRSDPLEALQIQYADYAIWQRQWLQGEILEAQLNYWHAQLKGAAPQLELPTDKPRPAAQSYRGDNVEITLDAQLSGWLKAFAQRRQMTLFMVLYGAWAILMSRLSAQEDVVIGTPVANRQRPELESLIGFFVNTLVLRIGVRDDLPVEEYFDAVREVTLSAYDHQDAPFEKIVEALQLQRDLSRNPLFQVMLVLQNAPTSVVDLPGLTVTAEDREDEPAMFDLLLVLEDSNGGIAGYVNYATDLFERRTVERWMASFVLLLKGIVGDPNKRIGDLPILPEEERSQVVEHFNATQTAYARDKVVHELFEAQVRRTPHAVALIHEDQSLTYAELNARANQLAHYLREKAVGPGQLVGICVERGVEMVIGLLGILKAGGAYVPLDPNYPAERLQYMLEDAAPQVVLTQEKLSAAVPQTQAQVILLDTQSKEIAESPQQNVSTAEAGLTSEDLVYVIYTSGSTGRPKGTAMGHRSMVNLIEWHRRSFAEGRRVLQFAALSFDVAFQETFSTLCTGSALVLLDEWIRRDVPALAGFLSRHSIQRLFVPPLMLQSLAECCQATGTVPQGLQDVITAGEQLRISTEIADFFKRLPGSRLHNHYGPTETHVVTALTLQGDPGQWPALPAIGRPISNSQIYILDGRRHCVPIGVVGEIYIGGEGVAQGYRNRPELTQERFVADPFSTDAKARLYKTGDLGRWRADGTIEYLGRNDDQVKIRGYRIELGEIEDRLARHEKVKEAAVVVREDVPGEKRLVGYITLRDQGELSVEDLRSHLKESLPDYMVPSAFVTLASLPSTPNGKLDRRALPAPDLAAYASQQYEAPQGAVEQALAQIWQELLHVERVGRNDNFFELGGHSLHGVKLVASVADRLGAHLSVAAVFRYPTIQHLAGILESIRRTGEGRGPPQGAEFEEGILLQVD